MSQTIVCQVLDYYTDKTTSMAVKIAKQKDELEFLKKEMAYAHNLHQQVRDELDQVREERDTFLADLRLRQVEARQARERLEIAQNLLERLAHCSVIIWQGRAYYAEETIDPIRDAAREWIDAPCHTAEKKEATHAE